MQTLYEILEVSPNASQEVIKMSYKALCKKYHPDVYKGADADERMKLINHAYEILSDDVKRRQYDVFTSCNKGKTNDSNLHNNHEDLKRRVDSESTPKEDFTKKEKRKNLL